MPIRSAEVEEDDWVHLVSPNGSQPSRTLDDSEPFSRAVPTNVDLDDLHLSMQLDDDVKTFDAQYSTSVSMEDSGISASMQNSGNVQLPNLPHSGTSDSMLDSVNAPSTQTEEPDEFNQQVQDVDIITEDSVLSEDSSNSQVSLRVNFRDANSHEETVIEAEVTTDDPTLQTETRVEILPDGTVVTRKITKTIRKRMVAKSVLTKSDDGEVTLSPDDENADRVKKFLSLGVSSQLGTSSKPASDRSPIDEPSTARFLAMTKEDVEDIEQTYTDDLPTDTHVQRKITVVQSQTTCIEGDDAVAQSSSSGMASAPTF